MKFSMIGVSFNILASWSQTEPELGREQECYEIPVAFVAELVSSLRVRQEIRVRVI